jgi:hypothetical protein
LFFQLCHYFCALSNLFTVSNLASIRLGPEPHQSPWPTQSFVLKSLRMQGESFEPRARAHRSSMLSLMCNRSTDCDGIPAPSSSRKILSSSF